MPYNEDSIEHSQPTPPANQEVFRRTPADIEKTRQDLIREHKMSTLIWIGIVGVFAILLCFSGIWIAVPTIVFIAAFMAIKNQASYKAAQSANEMTLGAVYNAGAWSSKNTATIKLIKDLCRRYEVSTPSEIVYFGNSFGGEYDPNTATVVMGKYLADFETDASFATGLHECCHHILVNEPKRGRQRKMQLEIAGITRMMSTFFAILYVLTVLLSPNMNEMQTIFSFFIMSLLISKACITTHEYETNDFAKTLLFSEDSPKELDLIQDRERAFSMLKDGERTYTVDIIGWIIIAIFLCVVMPLAF